MLSKEPFIRNDSNYFVYSPSKNAMEMFLYPLQCGQFTYLPGYRLVRKLLTASCSCTSKREHSPS